MRIEKKQTSKKQLITQHQRYNSVEDNNITYNNGGGDNILYLPEQQRWVHRYNIHCAGVVSAYVYSPCRNTPPAASLPAAHHLVSFMMSAAVVL